MKGLYRFNCQLYYKCTRTRRNIWSEHNKKGAFDNSDSKKLTDLRLLLSFNKSSETTSKSEDTEVRSDMVAAGTSTAARPVQTHTNQNSARIIQRKCPADRTQLSRTRTHRHRPGWLGETTKQTPGARHLDATLPPAQQHRMRSWRRVEHGPTAAVARRERWEVEAREDDGAAILLGAGGDTMRGHGRFCTSWELVMTRDAAGDHRRVAGAGPVACVPGGVAALAAVALYGPLTPYRCPWDRATWAVDSATLAQ